MVTLEEDICGSDEAGVDEEGEMGLCVEWLGRVDEVVGEDPRRILRVIQVAQLFLLVDRGSDAVICGVVLRVHFCCCHSFVLFACMCVGLFVVQCGVWCVRSEKWNEMEKREA